MGGRGALLRGGPGREPMAQQEGGEQQVVQWQPERRLQLHEQVWRLLRRRVQRRRLLTRRRGLGSDQVATQSPCLMPEAQGPLTVRGAGQLIDVSSRLVASCE